MTSPFASVHVGSLDTVVMGLAFGVLMAFGCLMITAFRLGKRAAGRGSRNIPAPLPAAKPGPYRSIF